MGEFSAWHWIITLLAAGNLAMIIHIAVSHRTHGWKKGLFVLFALFVPLVPYLIWMAVRDSAPNAKPSKQTHGPSGENTNSARHLHQSANIQRPESNPAIEEDSWAIAAEEVDGPNRRKGLWAKAYADAQGDEKTAKINYLKWRVEQLQQEYAEKAQQQLEMQERQQRLAEEQALSEARLHQQYQKAVRELDTAPESNIIAFIGTVPKEYLAYVLSLKNEVGGTLLHTAAREGFLAGVETLLTSGADPSVTGAKGALPHELAARNGHAHVAQILEKALKVRATNSRER